MLKIIGVLFVMFSGMSFGFLRAAREQKKYEQGIGLKRMLYMLQGEIRYGFTPLTEALDHISLKVRKEFAPFLSQVTLDLNTYEEESFFAVWSRCLTQRLEPVLLDKTFIQPLVTMGETVGYLDQEMQLKTIQMAIDQVDDMLYQMKDKVVSNCKLYRSLGMSFSALVIIILI